MDRSIGGAYWNLGLLYGMEQDEGKRKLIENIKAALDEFVDRQARTKDTGPSIDWNKIINDPADPLKLDPYKMPDVICRAATEAVTAGRTE